MFETIFDWIKKLFYGEPSPEEELKRFELLQKKNEYEAKYKPRYYGRVKTLSKSKDYTYVGWYILYQTDSGERSYKYIGDDGTSEFSLSVKAGVMAWKAGGPDPEYMGLDPYIVDGVIKFPKIKGEEENVVGDFSTPKKAENKKKDNVVQLVVDNTEPEAPSDEEDKPSQLGSSDKESNKEKESDNEEEGKDTNTNTKAD